MEVHDAPDSMAALMQQTSIGMPVFRGMERQYFDFSRAENITAFVRVQAADIVGDILHADLNPNSTLSQMEVEAQNRIRPDIRPLMSTARYYELAAGKASILPQEEWDPSFESIQVKRGSSNSELLITGIQNLADRR